MITLRVEWLYAVSAPHFNAALVVRNGNVIVAAPILKWAIGKRWPDVRKYFEQMHWGYELC